MTASDLINSSLRLIGILASGETASASESSDALTTLNNLIDSMSNENLLIFNNARETFPLVAGQQTYTIGTGGNFNTSRPQKVVNALIQPPNNTPVIELPMKILNQDEYANVLIKTLQSTFPLYLYVDGSFPLDNINVWPVPSVTCNIVLYSWKPLANIANLTTALSLPPGYARMLQFNLAIDLAAEYGRQLMEPVPTIAVESKAVLKRKNATPQYLQVDEALQAVPATWNWLTGDPQ